MKYFGRINDPKDLVTKEYVDGAVDEYVSIERIRTGNPIQFVGDSATVITDVTDYIEPAQDLHGYSKPWAPGMGDNMAEFPSSFTLVRTGPQARRQYFDTPKPAGEYRFTCNVTNNENLTNVTVVSFSMRTESGIQSVKQIYISKTFLGLFDNVVQIDDEFDTIDIFIASSNPDEATVTLADVTFSVNSNICPITGFDEVTIKRYGVTESDNPQVINVDFGQTVYSGTYEALFGTLTVTSANIASYAGETLPGKWISSMDVYSPGATPTTGAQVVYELAQPVTYQLTPNQILALVGQNTVSTDVGTLSVSFIREPVTRRAIMPKAKPVTLTLVGWNNKSQTVSVSPISGVEGTQLIQPVPASGSKSAYEAAGVQASAEGVGTLTFTCDSVPESDLTVYVVVTELEVVA